MANPGQLVLINAEIDGDLDAAQRAELARTLLADPKARELRDDLRRLCQTLDAVPLVDPPPGLQESILAAMPQMAPMSAGIPKRWTGMMALVRDVIAASSFAGSSVRRAGSISTKTGRAPT